MRACNFPISSDERCKQPITGNKPNCGRHKVNLSADQLGQSPTVYQKDDELHVWAGEPDGVYCLIHSDSGEHVLYQLAGEKPPCCLQEKIERKDEDGELHRDDGPAVIDADGAQYWYQHGKRHREDGPAVIEADGTQEWWRKGECHRDDGPAIIDADGGQIWCQHDEWHREDGPAIVEVNGTQKWYQHDEIHRDDGPAWIEPDGTQKWYWFGWHVTEQDHTKLRERYNGI